FYLLNQLKMGVLPFKFELVQLFRVEIFHTQIMLEKQKFYRMNNKKKDERFLFYERDLILSLYYLIFQYYYF
ncbi:hypothetical protein, partial [Acinetobacter bereziniae]|uniref:hypothetical protein n=1 Tax=Acinetobacter bereziniae TaxID=106648 RepID=UPI0034CD78AA